jgi:hypothetical protein
VENEDRRSRGEDVEAEGTREKTNKVRGRRA